jgi:hypothetical protein
MSHKRQNSKSSKLIKFILIIGLIGLISIFSISDNENQSNSSDEYTQANDPSTVLDAGTHWVFPTRIEDVSGTHSGEMSDFIKDDASSGNYVRFYGNPTNYSGNIYFDNAISATELYIDDLASGAYYMEFYDNTNNLIYTAVDTSNPGPHLIHTFPSRLNVSYMFIEFYSGSIDVLALKIDDDYEFDKQSDLSTYATFPLSISDLQGTSYGNVADLAARGGGAVNFEATGFEPNYEGIFTFENKNASAIEMDFTSAGFPFSFTLIATLYNSLGLPVFDFTASVQSQSQYVFSDPPNIYNVSTIRIELLLSAGNVLTMDYFELTAVDSNFKLLEEVYVKYLSFKNYSDEYYDSEIVIGDNGDIVPGFQVNKSATEKIHLWLSRDDPSIGGDPWSIVEPYELKCDGGDWYYKDPSHVSGWQWFEPYTYFTSIYELPYFEFPLPDAQWDAIEGIYSQHYTLNVWANASDGYTVQYKIPFTLDPSPLFSNQNISWGQIIGDVSPTLEISIQENHPNTSFYYIEEEEGVPDSSRWVYFDLGECPISPTATASAEYPQAWWNAYESGLLYLGVGISDLTGEFYYQEIPIEKDGSYPQAIVNTPVQNQSYGNILDYNITIIEDDLIYAECYILQAPVVSGNKTIIAPLGSYLANSTFTGTINPLDWNAPVFHDGGITLVIAMEDAFHNNMEHFHDFVRDTTAPYLSVSIDYEYYGDISPEYFLDYQDTHSDISDCYYQINDNPTVNYSVNITDINSWYIDDSAWAALSEGRVNFTYYMTDTCNNAAVFPTYAIKDTISVNYSIISPTSGIHLNSAPTYQLDFIDTDVYDVNITVIDSLGNWFSEIITNLYNETTHQLIGQVNPTLFNILEDGPVSLYFIISDYALNENTQSVTIGKDQTGPAIDLLHPSDMQVFDGPLAFSLIISDYTAINTTWLTIDDIHFQEIIGATGVISLSTWYSLNEGYHTIKFFANDSFGQMETPTEIIFIKDTVDPVLTINSPANNSVHNNFFVLDYSIDDQNPDRLIVAVDGNPFMELSDLNATFWNSLVDGQHIFIFRALDLASQANHYHQLVYIIHKDTTAPLAFITNPTPISYWAAAPGCTVGVVDEYFAYIQYRINGSAWYSFAPFMDSLNGTLWNSFEDGPLLIEFIVFDQTGLNTTEFIILYKDSTSPLVNLISPVAFGHYTNVPPTINFSAHDLNLDSIFYSINNSQPILIDKIPGQMNYSFMPSAIWSQFGNGTLYIQLRCNDSAGTISTYTLIMFKDILGPIITIKYPIMNQSFGIEGPLVIFTIGEWEQYIGTVWYSLDGGKSQYILTSTSFNIPLTVWEDAYAENVTIGIYALDVWGNLGFTNVTVLREDYYPRSSGVFEGILENMPSDVRNILIGYYLAFIVVVVAVVKISQKIKRKEEK